jgi:hypothetical protein
MIAPLVSPNSSYKKTDINSINLNFFSDDHIGEITKDKAITLLKWKLCIIGQYLYILQRFLTTYDNNEFSLV